MKRILVGLILLALPFTMMANDQCLASVENDDVQNILSNCVWSSTEDLGQALFYSRKF